VAVSGNYAYLANYTDGLRVYNIGIPTNPVNIGNTNNGGVAYGVTVSGNYAYLANQFDGLRVYVLGVVGAGSFRGDGSELTGLNASQLAGGTLPNARLSTNVSLLGASIESAEITDGTIMNADINAAAAIADTKLATISTVGKVADSALSANVALRSGGNTFGGDQTITNGNLYFDNAKWILAKSTNGTYENFLWPRWVDDVTYLNYGTNGFAIRNSSSVTTMFMKNDGNVGIGMTIPTNKLHVAGGVSATAFVSTSDRNAKENFAPVSPVEVLNKVTAMPITTWNFKDLKDGRHMGPMAQDFYTAFGLGGGDTTITSVDPDGVALAAIQGLNEKVEAGSRKSEDRIQKLEGQLRSRDAENAELKARLEKLEKLLNHGANRGLK
jgi:hypothetical protein